MGWRLERQPPHRQALAADRLIPHRNDRHRTFGTEANFPAGTGHQWNETVPSYSPSYSLVGEGVGPYPARHAEIARMDNPPTQSRPFTMSLLPWFIGAAMLALYLTTLASWITLPALNLTAQVAGWEWWNPKIGRPLYHLLTLPVKALPAGTQILALNIFAAVCSVEPLL